MDKNIEFIFEHRKDKDQFTRIWSLGELVFGVGEADMPIKELIEAYIMDGYILIDTVFR